MEKEFLEMIQLTYQAMVRRKANGLVDQYRMILMDEDTECGNEILCTLIAVKMAKVTCSEVLSAVSVEDNPGKTKLWGDITKELDCI